MPTLLRNTLILNAASCIGFGLLFIFASPATNHFIGNPLTWLTPLVGMVLVFNGAHLIFASRRERPLCLEVLYFIGGDLLWVIGSILLVALGLIVTTPHGGITAILVALMVGSFAALQFFSYRKSCA